MLFVIGQEIFLKFSLEESRVLHFGMACLQLSCPGLKYMTPMNLMDCPEPSLKFGRRHYPVCNSIYSVRNKFRQFIFKSHTHRHTNKIQPVRVLQSHSQLHFLMNPCRFGNSHL